MIAVIREIRDGLIRKAERRKKIEDALVVIGMGIMIFMVIWALATTIGDLPPMVSKGVISLGG